MNNWQKVKVISRFGCQQIGVSELWVGCFGEVSSSDGRCLPDSKSSKCWTLYLTCSNHSLFPPHPSTVVVKLHLWALITFPLVFEWTFNNPVTMQTLPLVCPWSPQATTIICLLHAHSPVVVPTAPVKVGFHEQIRLSSMEPSLAFLHC